MDKKNRQEKLRMGAYKCLLVLFTGRRRSCSRGRGDSPRRVGNMRLQVNGEIQGAGASRKKMARLQESLEGDWSMLTRWWCRARR